MTAATNDQGTIYTDYNDLGTVARISYGLSGLTGGTNIYSDSLPNRRNYYFPTGELKYIRWPDATTTATDASPFV